MKCKNCGGELTFRDGLYHCEFCSSTYTEEELNPTKAEAATGKFIVQGGVLVSYTGSKPRIVLPDGIVAIGPNAFKDNVALESISFSKNLTTIGDYAFFGCRNLKSVNGTDNVKHYGHEAFRYTGLQQVSIGAATEFIGRFCFANISNLVTLIYTPQKDLKLDHAFASCENLTDVRVDKMYFFPSFYSSLQVQNNPNNKRPTFFDAFADTPFFRTIRAEYMESYKKGICPQCGGPITKGLFHARCKNCGVDLKN